MASGGFEEVFVGEGKDSRYRPKHPGVIGAAAHSGLIRKICGPEVDGSDYRLPEDSGLMSNPADTAAADGWMSLNKRGRFRLVDQFRSTAGLIDAQAEGLKVSCVEMSHNGALEPLAKASDRVTAEHLVSDGLATHRTPRGGKFRHDQSVDSGDLTAVRYEVCLPLTGPSITEKLSRDARKSAGKKLNRPKKNFAQTDLIDGQSTLDYCWSDDGYDHSDEFPTEVRRSHSMADFLFPQQSTPAKKHRQKNLSDEVQRNLAETDKPRLMRLLTQIDEVLQPGDTVARPSLQPTFAMSPLELNLMADDLDADHLANTFGLQYVECPTVPRRFIIDLSDRCAAEVQSRHRTDVVRDVHVFVVLEVQNDEFTTVDDDGKLVHRCKMWINGRFTHRLHDTKTEFLNPLATYGIDKTLLAVVKQIGYYPRNFFPLSPIATQMPPASKTSATAFTPAATATLADKMPPDAAVAVLMTEVQKAKLNDAAGPSGSGSALGDSCEICASVCEGLWGLRDCGHLFCPDCWSSYLVDRIGQESVTLPCPHFGCDLMVDFDTLRTTIDVPLCDRYGEQICRHFLTYRASEWLKCPQVQCGRIVRLPVTAGSEAVVACDCGTNWCSACQADAHWPATCDQAQFYREKMVERGDYTIDRSSTMGKMTAVRVRKCPHCHVLLEKVEGCDHISCVCGKSFCYNCGLRWTDYNHVCPPVREEHFKRKIELVDVPKSKLLLVGSWYDRAIVHHAALQKRNFSKLKADLRALKRFWSAGDLSDSVVGVYQQAHSTLELVHPWLHLSKSELKGHQRLNQLCVTTEFLLMRLEEAAECGQADRLTSLLPTVLNGLKRLISGVMAEKRS